MTREGMAADVERALRGERRCDWGEGHGQCSETAEWYCAALAVLQHYCTLHARILIKRPDRLTTFRRLDANVQTDRRDQVAQDERPVWPDARRARGPRHSRLGSGPDAQADGLAVGCARIKKRA